MSLTKVAQTILILVVLLLFSSLNTIANPKGINENRKSAYALGINEVVKIDGLANESFWNLIPKASNFIQYSPYNGKSPSQKTEVQFAYDNHALYIFAHMSDNSDSISYRLSKRDETNQCDYFGINIDPFNDGLGSYQFYVTTAGVQLDARNNGGEDWQWNSVWQSEVVINDNGWSVEMAIPYSAIRFPKKEIQEWGINMVRMIQRSREKDFWNFVDINIPGLNKQLGLLLGIEKVTPPLRLSVAPYVSTYVEKYGDDIGYSIKGGLDLKYGINESFTLDMMLIPDFGQVASDREVVNLGPYETFYSENRDFFKEGMELFTRGDIFHSRRIGGRPIGYYKIELDSNEIITENPSTTQLVNASKITGKTKSGFSLGFLNAFSLPTHATIRDTITDSERIVETQSATNQNVTVVEQSLKNNSFISLINTNNKRTDGYYANATAVEMLFGIKSYHTFSARGAYTRRDIADNPDGFLYRFNWSKIRGKFRYSATHRTESSSYDPNDIGFSYSNDKNTDQIWLSYSNNDPSDLFLNWNISGSATYDALYEYSKFKAFNLDVDASFTLLNHLSMGLGSNIKPIEGFNYDEPRIANRKFKTTPDYNASCWISSDYRKPIAFDFNIGAWQTFDRERNGFWFNISPRFLVADNLFFIYKYSQDLDHNTVGYVGNSANRDSVYFGRRDYKSMTNTFELDYILNKNSSLTFRFNHNWTRVDYIDYHLLLENGDLEILPSGVVTKDAINGNFFNVDFVYSWQFAPGSELSIVWKNAINEYDSNTNLSFIDNLNQTVKKEAQNSFSLRILYYLDYLHLKKKLTRA